MAQDVRFIMIGGFLGAGKTTALIETAKRLAERGKRVGLITNDQAEDLVDTGLARAQQLSVEEIPGGCFCCRFNDLVGAADRILAQQPDVLLGEPVGSCTDISATVFQPLKDLYGDWFRMAPFSVLVDPARARKLLLRTEDTTLPENVAYLFRKQLEEADRILLNKTDLLSAEALAALVGELEARFPDTPVCPVSFKEGTGVGEWLDLVLTEDRAGERLLDIDYERYADAEAVLGWLNATLVLRAETPFDSRQLATQMLGDLQEELKSRDAEIAHVKLLVATGSGTLVANVVALEGAPTFSGDELEPEEHAVLTLNARVHLAPSELRALVEKCTARIAASGNVEAGIRNMQCFSPSPPNPTHRYDHVVQQKAA